MSFYEMMTVTFLSLLPIVNPVGMATFFLSMTDHLSPEERHRTAYMVAFNSFVLLCCVLFFGRAVLEVFGLTLPFIRIAGGLLVAFTAWQMLNIAPRLTKQESEEHKMRETGKQMAFFPLTLPLTAGSGAIAITVALAVDIPTKITMHSTSMYLGAVAGILGMSILIAVCYRFGDYLLAKLGTTGSNVVTRLSAFILMAIGMQVMWNGIMPLLVMIKDAK
ncbi:MAG: MarC family protein [Lentisphaerota bacterium]